MVRSKKSATALTCAILAAVVFAAVAAISAGSETDPSRARASEATRLEAHGVVAAQDLATSPTAQQQTAFGILRRNQMDSDRVPDDAAANFAQGYSALSAGMNVSLARRATVQNGAVWVVPGNAQACMIVNAKAVPAGASRLDADASTCLDDDGAVRGGLFLTARIALPSPHEFVAGLVPDGVESVAAKLSDGSTVRWVVSDNVYTADLSNLSVATIEFRAARGEVVTLQP